MSDDGFDFESYCNITSLDDVMDESDAICEIKGLVDGAITGIDTFFLLFGVSCSAVFRGFVSWRVFSFGVQVANATGASLA